MGELRATRVTRGTRVLAVAIAAAVLASGCALVTRVSVGDDGAEADGKSGTPSLSDDGRFVAFESNATDLVPGDTNDARDVFVRDRVAGTTERVSVAGDGSELPDGARTPAISGDGSTVAFVAAGDGDAAPSGVAVRDRDAGTTVTVTDDAPFADYLGVSSSSLAISADGRYVVYVAFAFVQPGGQANGDRSVHVVHHDLVTGVALRVSDLVADPPGGLQWFASPAVSADGAQVLFARTAEAPTDPPPEAGTVGPVSPVVQNPSDLWIVDVSEATAAAVPIPDPATTPAMLQVALPSLTADGTGVLFTRWTTALAVGGVNEPMGVWYADLAEDTAELVAGGTDDEWAYAPPGALDGGGRYLSVAVFDPDDLLDGSLELHAPVTRVLDRVSGRDQAVAFLGVLSADGRYLAGASAADDLVPDDTNEVDDVFVRAARRPEIDAVSGALTPGASAVTVPVEGWALGTVAAATFTGGPGITVDSVDVVDDGLVELTVSVSPDAPLGPRDLWLLTTEAATAVAVGGIDVEMSSGACAADERMVRSALEGWRAQFGESPDTLDDLVGVFLAQPPVGTYDYDPVTGVLHQVSCP